MDIQEYLQHRLEEEGTFRAYPVTWTVEEKESGAVAIAFQFAIHSRWHGKEAGGWSEDWAPGYFTENRTWVIRKPIEADPEKGIKAKPSGPNTPAIANLAKCGLWNGDWDALQGPVPQVFVLIEVGSENYNNQLRYRADWINPNADEPKGRGGFAPASAESLTSLRARFGSATRSIAGGGPGGPAAAPPTAAPVQPAPAPVAAPVAAPTPAPAVSPAPAPAAPAAPPAVPPTAAPAPAPAVAPPTPAIPAPAQPPAVQPPTADPGGFAGPPATGTFDDPIDPEDTPF